ncbi:hypothetical protein [Rhizobium sp. CSW-27]|nr:hypothetical protein [Rhizobium sp. CSW-27]
MNSAVLITKLQEALTIAKNMDNAMMIYLITMALQEAQQPRRQLH